jgi:hypothetical protein
LQAIAETRQQGGGVVLIDACRIETEQGFSGFRAVGGGSVRIETPISAS